MTRYVGPSTSPADTHHVSRINLTMTMALNFQMSRLKITMSMRNMIMTMQKTILIMAKMMILIISVMGWEAMRVEEASISLSSASGPHFLHRHGL